MFLLPYGFCIMVNLKEYAKERFALILSSSKNIGIHIEDPMKSKLIKLDYIETSGDKLHIGLDSQGLFEMKHFDLELILLIPVFTMVKPV